MEAKLQELKNRLLEWSNLNGAGALLAWDQATYMPPGGAPARARQLATLGRLAHETFTDPVIGRLLDDLRSFEENQPPDSDDAAHLFRSDRAHHSELMPPGRECLIDGLVCH